MEESMNNEAILLPHYIKLTRTTKGYTWEIKLRFDDLNAKQYILNDLYNLDNALHIKYDDI